MARPFPYTFISCPCADVSGPGYTPDRLSRDVSGVSLAGQQDEDGEEEERTFNPRSKRANYSLYPPEHLLYCEDCHQIKCPRCVTEEVVCWYCPNCLFETPSSMVKSEGNRCARNCFNCPVCTSPLSVTAAGNADSGSSQSGPWILACGYCMWTSLDVGIKFDKPTNIRAQLTSLTTGVGEQKPTKGLKSTLSTSATLEDSDSATGDDEDKEVRAQSTSTYGNDSQFKALKSFYRNQIAETSSSPTDSFIGPEIGGQYSSPSALNRIMSLYTSGVSSLHGGGSKKPKSKPPLMREALNTSEGLHVPTSGSEDGTIQKMASEGWEGLASTEQRLSQQPGARFADDLLPLPVLLRTKRSKRCKSCKHILVKPEFKPQSTRFRIRLIAISYIPLISLRPLIPPAESPLDLEALEPLKPVQFLLTLKNHMFDPIRVTLATPTLTPGRISTKVTILCPQFEVGANTDVWDEALQSGNMPDPRSSRTGFEKVAEAGKVWDKGRNWTTVAMEVVPGSLHSLVPGAESSEPLGEDDDVLEIPIFVRVEWEGETGTEDVSSPSETKKEDAETEKREVAYWMVLGAGRIKT